MSRLDGAGALTYWRANGALGLFTDGPDSPVLARDLRAAAERSWAMQQQLAKRGAMASE